MKKNHEITVQRPTVSCSFQTPTLRRFGNLLPEETLVFDSFGLLALDILLVDAVDDFLDAFDDFFWIF